MVSTADKSGSNVSGLLRTREEVGRGSVQSRSRECCRITRTRLEVCIAGGKAKSAYEYTLCLS